MIYIVEAFVEDYLHVLANVNTIKIFQHMYAEKPIIFVSPKKHNVNVRKFFLKSDLQIKFKSFGNLEIETSNVLNRAFLILSRMYRDLLLIRNIFNKCKDGDVVVLTHIYFPSLVTFKLLKKMYPRVTTYSVIHGDVEYAFFSTNLQQKVVGFFHKLMFRINAQKFYYIFLTPISKQLLLKSKYTKPSETFAIELPTFPNIEKQVTPGLWPVKQLRIAHLGSAGIRKNVNLYYALATHFQLQILNKELELSNIGVLEYSISTFLNPLIINYVDDIIGQPLTREVYDEKISQIDYAIFFYGRNDFILRSSAAFYDAVFYEKPIIALKNKYFEDLFNREGHIGYLCDNVEQMSTIIIELLSKSPEAIRKHSDFIKNLKVYKEKLSIKDISTKLKVDLQVSGIYI